jgi:hypothetical protein
VNDFYKEDLARLQESFNAAQSTMELLVRQMAELKLQLQAMSLSYAEEVTDLNDIDHKEQ